MGVGEECIGELLHAQTFQHAVDLTPQIAAAVQEHCVIPVTDEGGVAVVNLGEIDLKQFGVIREGIVVFGVAYLVVDDDFLCTGKTGKQQGEEHRQDHTLFHFCSFPFAWRIWIWRRYICIIGVGQLVPIVRERRDVVGNARKMAHSVKNVPVLVLTKTLQDVILS